MSYMHIPNLYKAQEILLFKRCYALEKIHGTSAHLQWSAGSLSYFSGGENYERFRSLFHPEIDRVFVDKFGMTAVTIYGEAYGGRCMGMSATYGKELRFVTFEVKIGDKWLSVPQAADVAASFNLDFVPYHELPTDLEALDALRDMPSEQALKLDAGEHFREGIVLRPLVEVTMNNGERIIAKHKREEFSERTSIPEVDPSKRELMENADRVALEWVTPMRLHHVLDGIRSQWTDPDTELDIKDTSSVIPAMIEDVTREAAGEIADNKAIRKAIGHRAAILYKQYLASKLSFS